MVFKKCAEYFINLYFLDIIDIFTDLFSSLLSFNCCSLIVQLPNWHAIQHNDIIQHSYLKYNTIFSTPRVQVPGYTTENFRT